MEFDCGGGDESSGHGLSSPKEKACDKVVASDGNLTVGQAVKEMEKMVAKEENISSGFVYRRVGEHDMQTVSVMQMGGEPAVHWVSTYKGTDKACASLVTINFFDSKQIRVSPVTEYQLLRATQDTSGIAGVIQAQTDKTVTNISIDGMPVWPLNHEYVTPSHNSLGGFFEDVAASDKNWTVVVAGESGSGKTVLACTAPSKFGYATLYTKVGEAEIKLKPETPRFHTWRKLVQAAMNVVQEENRPLPQGMLKFKSALNIYRNQWARQVLLSVIGRAVEHDKTLVEWWGRSKHGSESCLEQAPEKLAIVIDEATDLDLAKGIVDIGRQFCSDFASLATEKKIRLVVCSTGLDDLDAATEKIGTDESKSKTIIVQEPNIERVLESEKLFRAPLNQVLDQSRIAKALSSNTRMLFRGLLTTLLLDMHFRDSLANSRDSSNSAVVGRLVEFCNTPAFIGYAARLYIGSNIVKNLALLDEAFVFHLLSETTGLDNDFVTMVKGTEAAERREVKPDAIFHRGLARRGSTSAALRYLSCCGLSCPVDMARGADFETLVSFHLSRVMQLRGKTVSRLELKEAWPRPSGGGTLSLKRIQRLRDDLREVPKGSRQNDHIKDILGKANGCIVFLQRYPMAQGPDIFVVFVDGRKLVIHVVQCKHLRVLPEFATTKTWWSSLGVHVSGSGETLKWNCDRTCLCPAACPKVGIEGFAQHLLRVTGLDEYTIQKRVMATSQPYHVMEAHIPLNNDLGCQFLSLEMLQPTYSVFSPEYRSMTEEEEVYIETIHGSSLSSDNE